MVGEEKRYGGGSQLSGLEQSLGPALTVEANDVPLFQTRRDFTSSREAVWFARDNSQESDSKFPKHYSGTHKARFEIDFTLVRINTREINAGGKKRSQCRDGKETEMKLGRCKREGDRENLGLSVSAAARLRA